MLFAQQQNVLKKEDDQIKKEHGQIGIIDNNKSGYKHNEHPDAQWFANAGFGMFIHWGISS
jgi:alpha-L-fucosidase